MAAIDWTHVRVRKVTLARLQEVREALLKAVELDLYRPSARHDVNVTMDDVLSVLLDRDSRKRERARESKRRTRQVRSQAKDTSLAERE